MQRKKFLKGLTDLDSSVLEYDWNFWGRANQFAPIGDWSTWLILAGRSFGKTRSGVEWIRGQVEGNSPNIAPAGAPERIALVAETAADGRDVMVEGESGILACSRPGYGPVYMPSKRRLTWPNGIQAFIYSAEDPDQLRGPQHHLAWGDELSKWKYPADTWSNLEFGLRLGDDPRVCITTTPRPIKTLKEILADKNTVVTRGSTYDNRANLPVKYFNKTIAKYEGTRLGRQEIHAELLSDVPGALWDRDILEKNRVTTKPELIRIVVAVDPPVSTGENADECGIIVAGVDHSNHAYILADKSVQGLSPAGWAKQAVSAYHLHKADRIIAEVNNGGDLVENVMRQVDGSLSYRKVHATRGKVIRAEPIAALYEQSRVHHVGPFNDLEDQMCEFTTDFNKATMGYSPDRVDALVWALTELMLVPKPPKPIYGKYG